LKFTA
jgi:hypothetical protein